MFVEHEVDSGLYLSLDFREDVNFHVFEFGGGLGIELLKGGVGLCEAGVDGLVAGRLLIDEELDLGKVLLHVVF